MTSSIIGERQYRIEFTDQDLISHYRRGVGSGRGWWSVDSCELREIVEFRDSLFIVRSNLICPTWMQKTLVQFRKKSLLPSKEDIK